MSEKKSKKADALLKPDAYLPPSQQSKMEIEKLASYIINSVGDGLELLDMNGTVISVNPAFEKLTGFRKEEIVGKKGVDLISLMVRQEDFERCMKAFLSTLIGNIMPTFEFSMITKDGREVAFIVSASFVEDEKKIPIGIVVSYKDISERKRAEEALRSSEATVRALLNAPTDSIILVDTQGTILEMNEIAAKRFDKSKDDLIGKNAITLLPPDLAEERVKKLHRIHQTGEVIRDEDERQGIWFDNVYYPISDESGKVVKIAVVARDITERKKMERSLQESEGRFHALSDAAIEGIAIHERGKIIDVNNSFLKLFGCDRSDAIGKDILDFAAPESRDIVMKNVLSGYEKQYEAVGLRKDGTRIYGELSGRKIHYDGRELRVTALYDITERKLVESKLSAIHKFSEDLALNLDIHQIGNMTVDAICRILGIDNCALSLIDEEKHELYVEAFRGFLKELEHHRDRLEEKGITNWVACHGQSLLVPDVSQDERYIEWEPNIQSELCVPLKVKGKIIGALNVESKKLAAYNEKDQMLLETLAFGAATAIENARLLIKKKINL
jgi:PAS domain S-box-containing protein